MGRIDSLGEFDIFLDIGFIAYDVYKIVSDNLFGGQNNLGQNHSALGLDVVGAIVPGVTGLGAASRVVNVGETAIDAVKYTDKVGTAKNLASRVPNPTPGIATAPVRISRPLGNIEKARVRENARNIWVDLTGRRAIWDKLQVHHRIPLQWAHRFPRANPNSVSNLIGINAKSHSEVTIAWNAWRRALGERIPTQTEVIEQALKIDRQFLGQWVFPK